MHNKSLKDATYYESDMEMQITPHYTKTWQPSDDILHFAK
jgi:hypothetical protein